MSMEEETTGQIKSEFVNKPFFVRLELSELYWLFLMNNCRAMIHTKVGWVSCQCYSCSVLLKRYWDHPDAWACSVTHK